MSSLLRLFRGNRGRKSRVDEVHQDVETESSTLKKNPDSASVQEAATTATTATTDSKSANRAPKRLQSLRRSLSRLSGSIRRSRAENRGCPVQSTDPAEAASEQEDSSSRYQRRVESAEEAVSAATVEATFGADTATEATVEAEETAAVAAAVAAAIKPKEAIEHLADDEENFGCSGVTGQSMWRLRKRGRDNRTTKTDDDDVALEAKDKDKDKKKSQNSKLSFFKRFPSMRRKHLGAEGDAVASNEGRVLPSQAITSSSNTISPSTTLLPTPAPPLPPRRSHVELVETAHSLPKNLPPLLPTRRLKELMSKPPYVSTLGRPEASQSFSAQTQAANAVAMDGLPPKPPIELPQVLPRRYSHVGKSTSSAGGTDGDGGGGFCQPGDRMSAGVEAKTDCIEVIEASTAAPDAQVANIKNEESVLVSGAAVMMVMMDCVARRILEDVLVTELKVQVADAFLMPPDSQAEAEPEETGGKQNKISTKMEPELPNAEESLDSKLEMTPEVQTKPELRVEESMKLEPMVMIMPDVEMILEAKIVSEVKTARQENSDVESSMERDFKDSQKKQEQSSNVPAESPKLGLDVEVVMKPEETEESERAKNQEEEDANLMVSYASSMGGRILDIVEVAEVVHPGACEFGEIISEISEATPKPPKDFRDEIDEDEQSNLIACPTDKQTDSNNSPQLRHSQEDSGGFKASSPGQVQICEEVLKLNTFSAHQAEQMSHPYLNDSTNTEATTDVIEELHCGVVLNDYNLSTMSTNSTITSGVPGLWVFADVPQRLAGAISSTRQANMECTSVGQLVGATSEDKLAEFSSVSSLNASSSAATSSSSLDSVSSAAATSENESESGDAAASEIQSLEKSVAPASEVELVKSVAEAVSEAETHSEATASIVVESRLVRRAISASVPVELSKSSEKEVGNFTDDSLAPAPDDQQTAATYTKSSDTIKSLFISFQMEAEQDEDVSQDALDSFCVNQSHQTADNGCDNLVKPLCIVKETPIIADQEVENEQGLDEHEQLEMQQQLSVQMFSAQPIVNESNDCTAASGVHLMEQQGQARRSSSRIRFAEGIVVGSLQ